MNRTARSAAVAVIDEQACIGCTLCLDACPVDAIVGAAKFMHTVIAAECTGCRWCLAPCPVDCISIVDRDEAWTHEERARRAAQYRRRRTARLERLDRERVAQARHQTAEDSKRAAVERAMARARERLRGRHGKA